MIDAIIWLFAAFGIGGICVKCLGDFVRPSEKRAMNELLIAGWYRADRTPAIAFIRKPIGLLRHGFDALFGKSIISKRAFFFAALFGNLSLIAAISFSGVLSTATLTLPTPSALVKMNAEIASANERSLAQHNLVIPLQSQFSQYFRNEHTTAWAWSLGVFCYLIWVLISGVVYFAGVILIRLLLRELESAQGFLTFVMALIFDVLFTIGFWILGLLFFFIVATPSIWPTEFFLLRHGSFIVIVTFTIVFLFIFSLVLAIGGVQVKLSILVLLFPSVAVAISLIWAVVAFPFKRQIHFAITQLLLRAAESEKNALMFFGSLAAAISALIVFCGKHLF